MIVSISKESKDNLEVQFALSLVTSILVKQHFWIRLEELMSKKV